MKPTDGVLSEAWRLYREHWGHLIPLALVVYLVLAAVTALLDPNRSDALGALLAGLASLLALFWLQGALVIAVDDIRDGRRDLTLGGTFGRVAPRLGGIVVVGILASIGLIIGLALLIVPGLVLLTWWVVVVPVVVLEQSSPLSAFGRSKRLVAGYGWAVFKIILLTILINLGALVVLSLVLAPLDDRLQRFLEDVIGGSLTAPFVALVWTILYYRLREAKREEPEPERAAASV